MIELPHLNTATKGGRRDMNEGPAIIVSAIITVGGMVIIQVLNYLQRKKDFEEQSFREAYQKRLMVYEDVIKELQNAVMLDINKMLIIKGLEMAEIIREKAHLLDTLMSRLSLFGSTNSMVPLSILRTVILDIHDKCLCIPVEGANFFAIEIDKLFKTAIHNFINIVSTETERNFVDKKIFENIKIFTANKSDKKP
jgi:hypothetical protein